MPRADQAPNSQNSITLIRDLGRQVIERLRRLLPNIYSCNKWYLPPNPDFRLTQVYWTNGRVVGNVERQRPCGETLDRLPVKETYVPAITLSAHQQAQKIGDY